jgi:hypothetical protein
MLEFLGIARAILALSVDVFRLYRRNLVQPLMTAILLTAAYAVVHVSQEGNISDGLRSAFLDNDASREERHRQEVQATLQAELQQFAAASKLIDQHLETILSRAGASRVRLSVIHNGVTGLTGTGLLRYDVINSVAAPGRSAGAPVQNQPLSDWGEFLPDLLTGQCVMLRVSDLRSISLRARFESFGATNIMVCPAADVQGKAVGGVFTFWDGSDQVPQGQELHDLMSEARHVGAQIATVLDLRGPPPWPASGPASEDGRDR